MTTLRHHPNSMRPTNRLDHTTLLALIAMSVAVFVISNDFTALSVALPPVERQFETDVSTVQWVINAYSLMFGVLLVIGGRLADMFGRKRMFVVGSVTFACFSLLGGLAQDAGWLIACRALMGVGGAMMWPAILGMTYAALPNEKAGLAGGLILGVCGLGNAVGPLFGGALTDALSWRWIFYVNVPVSAVAVLITLWAIHQREPQQPERRIDYAGAAALSIGLVALLVALDQATDWGWGDGRVIALLAAFALLLGLFAAIERRVGEVALVPREVMRNRDFAAACVSQLLVSAVFFASVLYLPQFMQKILGYTPVKSGLGMLPLMATFGLSSFVAGPLYARLGAKLIVSVGATALALGVFLLSLVHPQSGYGALIAGMIVIGLGVALFYASVTTAGVTAVDPSRAALAGGIVYMFQIGGGSIGLGLNTTVFSAASEHNLDTHVAALSTRITDAQSDLAQNILAGTRSARAVIAQVGPAVGHRLEGLVRGAFVSGIHVAFRMDAALALAGLAVSVLFVGGAIGRQHLVALRRSHHNVVIARSGSPPAERGKRR